MADKLLDGGFANYPDAWDFVLSTVVYVTSPVTQGEVGISSNLGPAPRPFTFPPAYQGSPPATGNLVLDELDGLGLITSASIPQPPGPPIISPGFGLAAIDIGPTPAVICELFDNDLYGRIILTPILIEFGNVLKQQQETVEVWNSFFIPKTLNAIIETNTQGLSLLRPGGAPTEPAVYAGLQSFVYTVEVSTSGPAAILATYDFDFAPDFSPTLTVTGQRVIVMPARPTNPSIKEVLEFRTDILEAKDGTEQRIRVRDFPRQRISLEYFELDDEAAQLRNLLFDWLPRVWGVPVWWEERQLGADISATDVTITVDTTFADFRVGGSAVIFEDQFEFEALQILSLTAGSITFSSPVARAHLAKNTTVMPLRLAYANPRGPTEKHLLQGQSRLSVDFTTIDNVDLGDASAFPTYKGQVLLDEPNLVRGSSISEGWSRTVRKLDPIAGPPLQLLTNDRSRLASRKSFFSATPQRLWEVRQLVHFLQGSVAPFYLPSFRPDMRATATIGAGSTTFDIRNIDFTDFMQSRQPFKNIRLVLNDGTSQVREILSSAVVDSLKETITIDSAFTGGPHLLTDIKRLELVALVRVRNDRVTFEHSPGPGRAGISMEVVTVQFDPA